MSIFGWNKCVILANKRDCTIFDKSVSYKLYKKKLII